MSAPINPKPPAHITAEGEYFPQSSGTLTFGGRPRSDCVELIAEARAAALAVTPRGDHPDPQGANPTAFYEWLWRTKCLADLLGRTDVHMLRSELQDSLTHCEHDTCESLPGGSRGETRCVFCKMEFIYCHGCSEANTADMPIYHAAPLCRTKAEKASTGADQ